MSGEKQYPVVTGRFSIKWSGQEVFFRNTNAFRFVAELIKAGGKVVTYDELAKCVWGDRDPDFELKRIHVLKHRVVRKLRDSPLADLADAIVPSDDDTVKVWDRGYALVIRERTGGSAEPE